MRNNKVCSTICQPQQLIMLGKINNETTKPSFYAMRATFYDHSYSNLEDI